MWELLSSYRSSRAARRGPGRGAMGRELVDVPLAWTNGLYSTLFEHLLFAVVDCEDREVSLHHINVL